MRKQEGKARPERPVSTEAVGTLVWLLDSDYVDRSRGHGILTRLRAVRDSEQFASLPDALREKVGRIIAESEAD